METKSGKAINSKTAPSIHASTRFLTNQPSTLYTLRELLFENMGLVYTIVGNGRLAKHLIRYFGLAKMKLLSWNRATGNHDDLLKCFELSDVTILAIKDDSIIGFIESNPILKKKPLIHCSGSIYTDTALGMHPLFSFADQLCDYETYQQIPFIVDNDTQKFKQLFPTLKNTCHQIPKENKPLYHALCVLSGNFTTILWSKFFDELQTQFNLPKEVAFPYLKSIMNNLTSNYKTALTGPLSRQDKITIDKNIAALDGNGFAEVYKAFVQATQSKSI